MNIIQKIIIKIDKVQRKHKPLAFGLAVVKKYGEDDAGYKAALLTYYGFLSLFPLLLILTTLTDYIAATHPELQADIVKGATDYIPVLGNQLAEHVGGLHSNGPALFIGLLFTLYGARGVADAFKHGVQHIWGIPKSERQGFPISTLKSLAIIVFGGVGFVFTAIIVGTAASAGYGWDFKLLSIIINFGLLFCLFSFLIKICLPKTVSYRQIRLGAVTASVGLIILQAIGGYLLSRELKNLDALYSYFALSLGLLFWIYLQAQIIFYAVEIAAVSDKKNWPRSLSGNNLTESDKRAAERLKFDL